MSGGVWASQSVGRQGVELGRGAVVEGQHELGPVGPEALQRVRQAGREVPEIASTDVGDGGAAQRVQHVTRQWP